MIEYPSIINSSKAPRKSCIAFDKLDGSNFRAKYTPSKGFSTFGTRTQLIDETTPYWNEMVKIFKSNYSKPLEEAFKSNKEFRDFREITVFGEFYGENSYAGLHLNEPHDLCFFDILLGHKQRKLLNPKKFLQFTKDLIPVPKVVYEGNLNDDFIKRVRQDEFGLKEGVICKGTESSGAFVGGVWMCKIKTEKYLLSLKDKFGKGWEKYAE